MLLVEDDRDLVDDMAANLRRAGFIVAATSDPREAVAMVSGIEPTDVVVTDIRMPEIDGLDLIPILKARLGTEQATQFIVMTGLPSVETAVSSLRLGAVDFLTKPVRFADLLRAVDAAVQRAREERAKRAELAEAHRGMERVEALLRGRLSGQGKSKGPEAEQPNYVDLLRHLLKARERRARMFDAALVAEPAWDMLLDLALARLSGERLSVTSVCIGSRAPMTTALRRIDDLTNLGLAQRSPDPNDARRRFVELTDKGLEQLLRYLAEVEPHPGS